MTPDIPPPPPGWAIVPADDPRLDCLPARPMYWYEGQPQWFVSDYGPNDKVEPMVGVKYAYALPIDSASQPWSLPPPPAGQAWHRDDWTADMLPEGWRPLLLGEREDFGDKELHNGVWIDVYEPFVTLTHPHDEHTRTRRPLPASQPDGPTWQATLAEVKAAKATAGANNHLFRGLDLPQVIEGMGLKAGPPPSTDPKGEAGKAKPPLALLPPEALRQAAWAHALGAAKYGPFNWRENKVCVSTYVSAMMRHIGQFLDGEDADAESGLSHLAHVIASANILIDAKHCGTLVEDRPRRSTELSPLCPD